MIGRLAHLEPKSTLVNISKGAMWYTKNSDTFEGKTKTRHNTRVIREGANPSMTVKQLAII